MNDELNQKISQFLDDDLACEDAIGLLQEIRLKPELADKFNRYEAISHALKSDVFLDVKTDFSARISQQLEAEPVYLINPKRRSLWLTPKFLALAASIAVFAVILQQGFQANAPQLASSLSVAKLNAEPTLVTKEVPLNTRIYEYLQAHNSSIYNNDEAELRPLTQVTSYHRE